MIFNHKLTIAAALALFAFALLANPAQAQTELMGPLRIRDMTPFNFLRLDLLPAHAWTVTPGSWAFEADLTRTNTFVMSGNVRNYLDGRRTRQSLTEADAQAILSQGEDSYYFDGELGLLDLTIHYGLSQRASVYLTLPVYDFAGGWLDGTVESFHDTFGFDSAGRDLVARDRFQAVASLGGERIAVLDQEVDGGMGDPVLGLRYALPLSSPVQPRWTLVIEGAAKIAVQDEEKFLSTGSNDYGIQASLQRKLRRQGFYLSGSLVRSDGRVFGIPVGSRTVPTLTAAYELGVTPRTNLVLQLYASESAVRKTRLDEIKANKYQVSVGARSRWRNLVYGLAVTENVGNFQNTPDIGVTLTLGWISP